METRRRAVGGSQNRSQHTMTLNIHLIIGSPKKAP